MRVALAVVFGIAAMLVPGTASAAPPGNDDFITPTVITSLPFGDVVNTTDSTYDGSEPQFCTFMTQTVWYSFTPATTQVVRADNGGTGFSTDLNVYRYTGGGPGGLNFIGCSGNPNPVTFTAQAGSTYFIQTGILFGAVGDLHVNVSAVPPPANDAFADASAITSLPYSDTADVLAASTEPGEPSSGCGGFQQSGSVWYRFTPSETASVSANANYPNIVAAYSGSSLANLTPLGCRNFGGMLTFRAEAGTTYYFQLAGLFGSQSVQLQLVKTPPPNAAFGWNPFDPSSYDTVTFFDQSGDPGQVGFSSAQWSFGDGGTANNPGCCPTHRYLSDGTYHVTLAVTTTDGRTGTITRDVEVRTHDVAVAKLTVPQSASAGQSRAIVVGLSNRRYAETVRIDLFRSTPSGWV
jgi:PKD domain